MPAADGSVVAFRGLTNSVDSKCAMAGQPIRGGRAISSTIKSAWRRRNSANVFSGLANRSVLQGSCSNGNVTIVISARPARISMISCWVRVKSVKPSRTTSWKKAEGGRGRGEEGRKTAVRSAVDVRQDFFRLPPSAFRLLQHVAHRPESPFGVEQAVLAQRLLIGRVDFGQFDVLIADAPRLAGVMELLRPDLQPFQLANELAHQIRQSAGRGDRLEMFQPAPRRLLADDLADQLAFHQSANGANRQPGGVQFGFGERLEGHHARTEAAAKLSVEQTQPDIRRRPPRWRQPERRSRRLLRQRTPVARQKSFCLTAVGRTR